MIKRSSIVNPFKPTAGAEPPVLVGREKVIDDFAAGLAEGVGARARLMRITGPRGSGKTVLLTELGDMAREQGWQVVDETAAPGLCDRIARAACGDDIQGAYSLDVHMGVADFRLEKQSADSSSADFREALSPRVRELTRQHRGLLLTIDEVQDADSDEIREIASAVQHFIREKSNIALVVAGLPMGVLDIVNGKARTFLRRALPEELGSIPIREVRAAMAETFQKSGMVLRGEALRLVAEATVGYAYLIQLVGYEVWRCGKQHFEDSKEITLEDAQRGIAVAMEDFYDAVHESAVADLPLRAVEYLLAMVPDDAVSSTGAVADRLGVPASSLTSYRRLLIQRQIIESTARGFVAFTIPYTREFLHERKPRLLARYGIAVEE